MPSSKKKKTAGIPTADSHSPPSGSTDGSVAAASVAAAADQNEILVVSYRSHHHVFDPDTPGVTFINRAARMTAPRRFLQFLFSIIMVHYFLWIIPMVGSVYFFYHVGWWPVSVLLLALYVPTFLNGDQYKSGRPWAGFRRSSLWRLTSRYIGIEVVRTRKLDPNKKYMFGLYPHGILILSRVAMYGGVWELCFPGVETRVLGASPMFWVPGSREICLWMGAVDAAKRVAMNVIEKFKKSLMVYPGGSDEIFETDPNSPVTTLVVRKGFIKLAVQTGADLVPGFVFGEKWLYRRRPVVPWLQRFFMRHLRMPLIVFWGRYFTWLPYHDDRRAFLTVVFGAPLAVRQDPAPSDEYIEELWAEYLARTRALYEEYKGRLGYGPEETLQLKEPKSTRNRKGGDKKKE